MELSNYVEALRRELGIVTRFASEDITSAAAMLTEALDAPVRLTLLHALSDAAADISGRLDDVVVDVRLSGGEPDFVVTHLAAAAPEPSGRPDRADTDTGASADEAGTARITLRLPESLKTRAENESAAAGLSVNAWLVRAIARAIDSPDRDDRSSRRGPGQRITGFARG